MGALLAVDLGLTTGLALYDRCGKLRWYRSQNYGNMTRLRRAIHGLVESIPDLELVLIEGGGDIADLWEREASRRGVTVRRVSAETWRRLILYPREQRSGTEAKNRSKDLARKIIEWSGIRLLKSLRHHTAEAILIGLWGALQLGWLDRPPRGLRN
ncbi:MAG TPA: hypothetical protein P5551_00850 [Syntrophales bacterium]|jgi:hypothetical protein|nr:hypothetical protein [Syntrophales bacterium]HRT60893.1 hypothetical protein [Syntrophales bacterium]